MTGRGDRSILPASLLPVLGLTLAMVAVLTIVPRRVMLPEGGAERLGFDPAMAHVIVTIATLLCVLGYGIFGRTVETESRPAVPLVPRPYGFALAVAGLVFLAYFPPVLARYGPYLEDHYFLSSLLRVWDGQRPYVDFEFLYGPLLIIGPAKWFDQFGFSLHSYYWLFALVEATTFGAIAIWVGRRVPNPRVRLLTLVALGALLVCDNLGLSWIAGRRILPIVALFWYAAGTDRRCAWLVSGGLIGLAALLSVEYAAAAGVAVGATAVLEAVVLRRWKPIRVAVLAGAVAIATTAIVAALLLGSSTGSWIAATWQIIALRGAGEAAFPFAVSANAFAVLALLFFACAWLGGGLRRLRSTGFGAGERFLALAVVYAVVALKSGLARSDMYHLVPPILGVVTAILIPLPFAALALQPKHRRFAIGLVTLLCLTYVPGLAGAGRVWISGFVLGATDLVTGRPADGREPARARGPRIGAERTEQDPDLVALSEFLASGTRATVPVLFYERSWGLDKLIGVPKPRGVYPTDDYLVSDLVGLALRDFLHDRSDALVVIDRAAWDFLRDPSIESVPSSMYWILGKRSLGVRFLEYWSSTHFGIAIVEERVRIRDRWARTVGSLLRVQYSPVGEFGQWLVLERTRAS